MDHILTLPDERLRVASVPVDHFSAELREFASELKQEMRRAQGIGLAAPQVGRHQQLLVMRLDPHATISSTVIAANPKIVQQRGFQRNHEGCLSVPSGRVWVERPREVVVEFFDERGKRRSLLLKGLAAACMLHEMDHLSGVLIPDYVDQFSQAE